MRSGEEASPEDIAPNLHYLVRSEITPDSSGALVEKFLNDPLQVKVRPYLARIAFYHDGICNQEEEIYPPSSNGWYLRMKLGKKRAIYIVQEILGLKRYWLTICDYYTGRILECHRIFPYEMESLIIIPFWDASLETDEEKRSRLLLELSHLPAPSWKELYELCKDIDFPNLVRTGDFVSTVSQLIPNWWSDVVRQDAIIFFDFLMHRKIELAIDPVELLYNVLPSPTLRLLLAVHMKSHLMGRTINSWPHLLNQITEAQSHGITLSPYSVQWRPQLFLVFNIGGIAVLLRYINILNKTHPIPRGLPVSKEEARHSNKLKLERLYLYYWGLNVFGRVYTDSIGLYRLYYIGKAYQWPHRHLAYTTSFYEPGSPRLRESLFHEIVVPARAADEIKSKRSGIMELDWYARYANPKKYYLSHEMTLNSLRPIITSLERRTSRQYFRKQYRIHRRRRVFSLSDIDIKILDSLSSALWLSDLEKPKIKGIPRIDFIESLERLQKNDVIRTFYWGGYHSMNRGIIIIINAPTDTILSLANAFFIQSGNSSIIKMKDNDIAVIHGTLNQVLVDAFCDQLNSAAQNLGIDLIASPLIRYRNYRLTLFSRLWKNGTWDDDVSNFLSQSRIKM